MGFMPITEHCVSEEVKIDSDIAFAEHIAWLRREWLSHKYLLVRVRTGKQRTLTQNRALHLFLGMLADELNAHNLDMRRVLKQDVDIPWNTENCKEFLWKPLQQALLAKRSTTEADRTEYTLVHEVLSKHLGEKFGVTVPEWPKRREAA